MNNCRRVSRLLFNQYFNSLSCINLSFRVTFVEHEAAHRMNHEHCAAVDGGQSALEDTGRMLQGMGDARTHACVLKGTSVSRVRSHSLFLQPTLPPSTFSFSPSQQESIINRIRSIPLLLICRLACLCRPCFYFFPPPRPCSIQPPIPVWVSLPHAAVHFIA